MSKKLVAYFSASGVTAKVAETLAEAIGADIFEIEPKVPYTERWRSLEQRTWEHISGRWRLTAISSRWTTRSRRNSPPLSAALPRTSIRFAAASTPLDTSMRTILQN